MSEQSYFESVDLSNISPEINCNICTYPMVNPRVTIPCGHALCGHCAEGLARDGPNTCHMCRQPRTSFCRNIFAEQWLARETAKCRRCNEDVALHAVQHHVDVECKEILTTCTHCEASIKRGEAEVHHVRCPNVQITCGCGLNIRRVDQENHTEECKLAEAHCPLGCGATTNRYLLPSHSLVCQQVFEKCPVRGCGQYYRRAEKEEHELANIERHYKHIKREKTGILWKSARCRLQVAPERSLSNQFVLTWSPLPESEGALASPIFEKEGRRWRMYYKQGLLRLEYVQGLEEIAVVISFFLKSREGIRTAYQDLEPSFILLKEGSFIEINTNQNTPPQSISVKVEGVDPTY